MCSMTVGVNHASNNFERFNDNAFTLHTVRLVGYRCFIRVCSMFGSPPQTAPPPAHLGKSFTQSKHNHEHSEVSVLRTGRIYLKNLSQS